MDASRFDCLTRSLTSSPPRRRFLGGVVAALSLFAPRVSGTVEGRKKKKRKKRKKLALNAFGCVDVGGACQGRSANCCSGLCQGKEPKQGKTDTSTCLAHNVGECQADGDFCAGIEILCGLDGRCQRTTGAASFCGLKGGCAFCNKDTDCEADFGMGAACIVCATCGVTNNTACVPPAALA